MAKIGSFAPLGAAVSVGCRELGESGLVDTNLCCARCHSADRFALDGIGTLGPCRETLPDGRTALVCCSARSQLR